LRSGRGGKPTLFLKAPRGLFGLCAMSYPPVKLSLKGRRRPTSGRTSGGGGSDQRWRRQRTGTCAVLAPRSRQCPGSDLPGPCVHYGQRGLPPPLKPAANGRVRYGSEFRRLLESPGDAACLDQIRRLQLVRCHIEVGRCETGSYVAARQRSPGSTTGFGGDTAEDPIAGAVVDPSVLDDRTDEARIRAPVSRSSRHAPEIG
jgi:hypothetical protein